jgi:hypothetical protein
MAEGSMAASGKAKRYRSLSSIGRTLLPRAETMHSEGLSWRQVARELKISNTALYIWRSLDAEAPRTDGWEDG